MYDNGDERHKPKAPAHQTNERHLRKPLDALPDSSAAVGSRSSGSAARRTSALLLLEAVVLRLRVGLIVTCLGGRLSLSLDLLLCGCGGGGGGLVRPLN